MSATRSHFAALAERYCRWIEAPVESPQRGVEQALEQLLELYRAALELRALECEDDAPDPERATEAEPRRRLNWLPIGFYATTDPLELEMQPLCVGDLVDDLVDVWIELRGPLRLFHAGYPAAAEWHWHFGFRHHWNDHAVSAIGALHAWLERERLEDR